MGADAAPLRRLRRGADRLHPAGRRGDAGSARPGGSPWNVARVAARLGVADGVRRRGGSRTSSGDELARARAPRPGLDRALPAAVDRPPLLACRARDGIRRGTSSSATRDLHFDPAALPAGWLDAVAVAHFGSISLAREPLASRLVAVAERCRARGRACDLRSQPPRRDGARLAGARGAAGAARARGQALRRRPAARRAGLSGARRRSRGCATGTRRRWCCSRAVPTAFGSLGPAHDDRPAGVRGAGRRHRRGRATPAWAAGWRAGSREPDEPLRGISRSRPRPPRRRAARPGAYAPAARRGRGGAARTMTRSGLPRPRGARAARRRHARLLPPARASTRRAASTTSSATTARSTTPRTRHLVCSTRFVFNFARAWRHDREPRWREALVHALAFLRDAPTAIPTPAATPGRCAGTAGRATRARRHQPLLRPGLRAAGVCARRGWPASTARAPHLVETFDADGAALLGARQPASTPTRRRADWSALSPYRGQNANMHACEAMLAAYEATREPRYLERAATLAEHVTRAPGGAARRPGLGALPRGLVGRLGLQPRRPHQHLPALGLPARPPDRVGQAAAACSSGIGPARTGCCRARRRCSTPPWSAPGTASTAASSTASRPTARVRRRQVLLGAGRSRCAAAALLARAHRRGALVDVVRPPLGVRLGALRRPRHGAWYRILRRDNRQGLRREEPGRQGRLPHHGRVLGRDAACSPDGATVADAILVLNAGSSSLKFEVFLVAGELTRAEEGVRRGAARPSPLHGP